MLSSILPAPDAGNANQDAFNQINFYINQGNLLLQSDPSSALAHYRFAFFRYINNPFAMAGHEREIFIKYQHRVTEILQRTPNLLVIFDLPTISCDYMHYNSRNELIRFELTLDNFALLNENIKIETVVDLILFFTQRYIHLNEQGPSGPQAVRSLNFAYQLARYLAKKWPPTAVFNLFQTAHINPEVFSRNYANAIFAVCFNYDEDDKINITNALLATAEKILNPLAPKTAADQELLNKIVALKIILAIKKCRFVMNTIPLNILECENNFAAALELNAKANPTYPIYQDHQKQFFTLAANYISDMIPHTFFLKRLNLYSILIREYEKIIPSEEMNTAHSQLLVSVKKQFIESYYLELQTSASLDVLKEIINIYDTLPCESLTDENKVDYTRDLQRLLSMKLNLLCKQHNFSLESFSQIQEIFSINAEIQPFYFNDPEKDAAEIAAHDQHNRDLADNYFFFISAELTRLSYDKVLPALQAILETREKILHKTVMDGLGLSLNYRLMIDYTGIHLSILKINKQSVSLLKTAMSAATKLDEKNFRAHDYVIYSHFIVNLDSIMSKLTSQSASLLQNSSIFTRSEKPSGPREEAEEFKEGEIVRFRQFY
jgi:hypothetical protein